MLAIVCTDVRACMRVRAAPMQVYIVLPVLDTETAPACGSSSSFLLRKGSNIHHAKGH